MDSVQTLMKPLIDAYGFHRGDIAPTGVNPLNSAAVVNVPLPQ